VDSILYSVLFKTHSIVENELEIGSSNINWAQLSTFHLKTETESFLQSDVCFKIKTGRWLMSRNTVTLMANMFICILSLALCGQALKCHISSSQKE
jgi:hypothetical protein